MTTVMSSFFFNLSRILRRNKVLLVDVRVHNLLVHNRQSKEKTRTTQSPRRAKDGDIGSFEGIDAPDDSGTSTLQRLVETGKVGEFSGFIGEGTHQPVSIGLPGGIEEAVEHVQEEVSDVARVEDVLLGGGDVTAGLEDKGESTTPDGVDEDEEDAPAGKAASATRESSPIEEGTEHKGAEDLGEPVKEVVEGAGADIEVVGVHVVELVGVEPVRSPEHGEEHDDIVIRLQGYEETLQFGPVRR